ncbi:glycosyltransferase family 4 protein [Terrisporobacter mayombei]|uniref:D-inositol-3-phosphate glycosyltransferase n=1 Tax=Terrisporobacter mayombei TaxID=1541 RepID=A0ABY9Q1A0_9FIRM|nr:glycosyltransferase family 4 protein [Terrisporobacter mayombei]MCC3866937.1 glycosyltransferase family 4 protein [Terrisporobacter mayombei]WMT81184.1 D-inositol-3-phosphate glycosyltransferase [Terrisporobacter mayombei]
MRILHITAQKPNSTGSGVYMNGVIESLHKLGHEQGIIAGIDIKDEKTYFNDNIKFYPMTYNTPQLPFSVIGMSDIIPYESTKYKELTEDMINKIKEEFLSILNMAIKDFKPDIIICNHLYLITSLVIEKVKDIKVIGICHGTCLRQLKNIDLKKDYIISNINKLDYIFALHKDQKEDIIKTFNFEDDKVTVIGSGYDDKVFYNKNYKTGKEINITYAGKICESKGIKSLLNSLNLLNYNKEDIIVNIAGSGSDKEEIDKIIEISKKSRYKVNFKGRLNHIELSELFNKSHIFILPSFYEGLPIVALEALSCGCKVIVSKINGLEDFIGDEINNSGNILYLTMPRMINCTTPLKDDLSKFEENIARNMESLINVIRKDEKKPEINMTNKTWDGLGKKIDKIIKLIV